MSRRQSGDCWFCGHTLADSDYVREARCPACSRATHCCRNCRFYKPGVSNACVEPIADHVSDKERANFCDYFEATRSGGTEQTAAEALKQAADDLFKP
jgi:hypothetical protein